MEHFDALAALIGEYADHIHDAASLHYDAQECGRVWTDAKSDRTDKAFVCAEAAAVAATVAKELAAAGVTDGAIRAADLAAKLSRAAFLLIGQRD